MIAPGMSCTAMPGFRSSAGRPGCWSTVPLVEPRSVATADAVVGARARADLEVGRGDLLVRARHGDQPRLLGGGEPAGLRRPADDDRPVDVDDLAAGEHEPGDRLREHVRCGRLPGMPGWLRASSSGSQLPAWVCPSWPASAGSCGFVGGSSVSGVSAPTAGSGSRLGLGRGSG